MAKFSGLTEQLPVSVTFEYGSESVTVVFDRNKITQNWARKVRQGIEAENVDDAVLDATVEIMLSWDVTEDDGVTPIPPSREILGSLPIAAFERLSVAIGNAASPSSEEGNGSTNISATQAELSTSEPVSPQNGQEPSPSPAPSASPLAT